MAQMFLWGVLCLCTQAVLEARAAAFSATLSPGTVTLGENAQLALTFENGQPDELPELPSVPGLQISYVRQSQSFRSVNFQTTVSVTHTYLVVPLRAGEFTLPAINASVGGATLTSQPLNLRVLPPGSARPGTGTPEADKLAFLKLDLPKTNVFVGEVLPVETQLYVRTAADQIQIAPLSGEGFTLGKMVQQNPTGARSEGVDYRMLAIKSSVIPTRPGALKLGPAECSLVLQVPLARRRRGSSLFDDFFGDPFVERRPMRLSSDARNLQVLPLPAAGRPATFTGAVGEFALAVTASPTNVAVGEPITLKVQISGRGALDNLTLPSLDGWKDFKVYPPTSRVEITDALGIEGTKTFEQVAVPQSPDLKELPGLAFSFFDPNPRAYRVLKSAPVSLVVRPSGATPPLVIAPVQPGGATAPPPPQDIVGLKTRLGAVSMLAPPLVNRPWFLGLQGLPVLAWLTALGWRRRAEHRARNPRLVRRQAVNRLVRRGLAELQRLAAAQNAPEYFAVLFRLLQEQLGERLDLPAAAITEAVLEERLRDLGVPAPTLAALHELFQGCNQARYAPLGSSQELAAWLPKLEAALSDLRRLKA